MNITEQDFFHIAKGKRYKKWLKENLTLFVGMLAVFVPLMVFGGGIGDYLAIVVVTLWFVISLYHQRQFKKVIRGEAEELYKQYMREKA